MAKISDGLQHIGMQVRNIELVTDDPVARGGFTQVPNFLFASRSSLLVRASSIQNFYNMLGAMTSVSRVRNVSLKKSDAPAYESLSL